MPAMGLREYARRRGVSHTAVAKAIRVGRLARAVTFDDRGRPRIDPEVADSEWEETTQPQDTRAPRPEPEPAAPPAQGVLFEGSTPAATSGKVRNGENASASLSLTKARGAEVSMKAGIAKLRYEQLRGILVRTDAVRAEQFRVARMVRDRILLIPGRIAADLAASTTPQQARGILELELHGALQALADELTGEPEEPHGPDR